MGVLKAFFIAAILCFFSIVSPAQTNPPSLPETSPKIIVSKLSATEALDEYVLLAIDSSQAPGFKNLQPSSFKSVSPQEYNSAIPVRSTLYPRYYSLNIVNDTPDTASLFIYVEPQMSVQLWLANDENLAVHTILPQREDRFFIDHQYFKITMKPSMGQRFVLRIEFPQTRFNQLFFWVGPQALFNDFVWFHLGLKTNTVLFDCLFLGMLIMMLVYMIAKYIQIRKLEYFYYAGYTFLFTSFFFLKLIEMLGVISYSSNPVLHSYFYKIFQVLAYWLYYLFIQEFLNTKEVFPRAHKLINLVIGCIIFYALLETILFFIPQTSMLRWQIWDGIRVLLVVSGLAFTISFIFVGNVLSRYLVAGGTALAFFAMLSMVFSANAEWIAQWPLPLSNGISYFEIGIMLELLFFALGLGHKNKMDEIEKVEAKQELQLTEERQNVKLLHALSEVQEKERSRFAKDLHDGLGGMLSGVKLSLSTIKSQASLSDNQQYVFDRSLDMLDNSIHELRRVAHNIMPEALVKFGLAAALKDFCDFVNSSNAIRIIFQQVGEERRMDLTIEVVVYRITTELTNNTLRHAQATELIIQLNYDDDSLTLIVEDNGVGFDKAILTETTGVGWPNIKSRVAFIKGSLEVETSPGNGTTVNIIIPIE